MTCIHCKTNGTCLTATPFHSLASHNRKSSLYYTVVVQRGKSKVLSTNLMHQRLLQVLLDCNARHDCAMFSQLQKLMQAQTQSLPHRLYHDVRTLSDQGHLSGSNTIPYLCQSNCKTADTTLHAEQVWLIHFIHQILLQVSQVQTQCTADAARLTA